MIKPRKSAATYKIRTRVIGLIAAMLLLSISGVVEGKLASCKTRFTRKMDSDYCTKFGTA